MQSDQGVPALGHSFAFVSLFLFPLSLLTLNSSLLLASVLSASVAAILLAIGFLAVALSPHRQVRTNGSLTAESPDVRDE